MEKPCEGSRSWLPGRQVTKTGSACGWRTACNRPSPWLMPRLRWDGLLNRSRSWRV